MKHWVVIICGVLLIGNLCQAEGFQLEVGHFVISGEPFPMVDGATIEPVQDGCLVQVLEDVGADGIAVPDAYGRPGSGDRLLLNHGADNKQAAEFAVNGESALQMRGGFLTEAAFAGRSLPRSPVWIRVWNAADPAAATAYWDSRLYTVLPGFQQLTFISEQWTCYPVQPSDDPRRRGRALDEPDKPSLAASVADALDVYPNPFNAQARVRLQLSESAAAALAVYDMLGRTVAALHDGPLAAGVHEFVFDAAALPTGTYYLAVRRVHETTVRKLLLVR